jgi:magnesium-transporting ATPase (P-type)
MANVKCVKNENGDQDMSEAFETMNWQLDQFTDQVLVALDQLISIVLSPFVWFFQHPLADFCKWLFGPQIFTTGEMALVVIIVLICAYAIFYIFPALAFAAIGAFAIPALLSLLGHIFHFGFKVLIVYLVIRFCIALVKASGKWIDKMLGLAPNR